VKESEERSSRKEHWESVYRTKPLVTVGWYQSVPVTSLELIGSLNLPYHTPLIDVGGGDSYLSDHLLQRGYTDLTVLDISGAALQRARDRHGRDAEKIRWLESDILEFIPDRTYTLWHDRATFHFLTEESKIDRYLGTVQQAVHPGGYLILGTFSDQGPATCSGLPVQRYSIRELEKTVAAHFKLLRGINLDHKTPAGGVQNYTFCIFEQSDGRLSE